MRHEQTIGNYSQFFKTFRKKIPLFLLLPRIFTASKSHAIVPYFLQFDILFFRNTRNTYRGNNFEYFLEYIRCEQTVELSSIFQNDDIECSIIFTFLLTFSRLVNHTQSCRISYNSIFYLSRVREISI